MDRPDPPSTPPSPDPSPGIPDDLERGAEQALLDSEARYQALVEQIPAVTYIVTSDTPARTLYVSPQVRDLVGYRDAELVADPTRWIGLIHPGDVERATAMWTLATERDEPYESEYRVVARDGTVRWVRDHNVPIPSADGSSTLRQGVLHDVSEQRVAAEALAESEARYRALVENVPAIVYVVAPDGDGSTLYVSPQVERLLGYAQVEWLDQPDIWMELLHPDDREPTLDAYDRHNETGEPWSREYRLIASDGRSVWFRDEATLVRDESGAPLFWQGVRVEITSQKDAEELLQLAHEDLDRRVRKRTAELEEANELMMLEVHERRRTEARLREAEERYRLLVERLPAVTYVWEIDRHPARPRDYTSPQIEDVLGYTAEEWNTDPDFWISRVHPHDRERVLAAAMALESTGEPYSEEFRYLAKDGRVVWVLDEAVLLSRDERGKPKVFQGVMIDITERRETATRLRHVESRALAIAEHLPAITYSWQEGPSDTESGPGSYLSPQITSILGYTPQEWGSHRDFYLGCIHPDDRARVLELDAALEPGSEWLLEYRYLAKDGRVVWVRDAGKMLPPDEPDAGPIMHGILIDITREKESEEQLRTAEERYRTLVEQIPAVTYIEAFDPSDSRRSRLVYVSPQASEVFGYSPEELIAEPDHMQRMIHPDDLDRYMEADARANRTGEPYFCEFRVRARDGREIWIQSQAKLVRDEEDRPRFWHGLALDITERRRVEEELRAMEERLGDLSVSPDVDPGT